MKKVWAFYSNDHYTSRGRKIHLTKDMKTTLCNLKVDEEYNRREVNNGTCKNCLALIK
jgi:hypothetical protein